MPSINIVRENKIIRTPRVLQAEGIFDISPTQKSKKQWIINIPFDEKSWNIGLIVGPSGCGKTTILQEMFKDYIVNEFQWHKNESILDSFPQKMNIKDILLLLSSVGFSSPPSWLCPFHVLSNGEQFRVNIARVIAESKEICVIDEFTSVVDRTVAKMGSYAIAKTIRRMNKKFIAASCHYDIEEWLQPDWIYKPHENEFAWRFLWRRPAIDLEIRKVHHSAWKLFAKHHYLSSNLSKSAQCFVAFWYNIPVAFYAYLHFPNNKKKNIKRGHRMVCLPDYQGCGIGLKLQEIIASALKAIGFEFIGSSAHPIYIRACAKSKLWKMTRKPMINIKKPASKKRGRYINAIATNLFRNMATFKYVGPALEKEKAEKFIYGK